MTLTLRRTLRRLPVSTAVGLAVVVAATGCGGTAPAPTGSAPLSVGPPATTPAAAATTGTAPPASTAPPTATVSPPSTVPSPGAATPAAPRVHFSTPEAAMRYLAAAYNRDDPAALKKVTNASARSALVAMRQEATNLSLTGCSRRDSGDYVCHFRHDYPARLHRSGHGQAMFLAAPAGKPGWYMTVLIACG
jgi:hypothetical protein